ncbi:MAG: DUF3644 domain-containing protein [Clostridia bacterium]|nr:DUF3644 domain-containing protein [Clostridia bacterium]
MNTNELIDNMISKSKEAFSLAIEIYNKPTIKYRVEGFAFFICNAWELMLKSYLIKNNNSIYYKNKPDRTISLSECVKKVFTNNKDPLRLNLEKIIELRDTSTHFITEEYEMVYITLFQSCILNFNEKMMAFHKIDMTEIIPQNFLTLSVSLQALEDSKIIGKYPEEIANKFLENKNIIEDLAINNNAKFSIRIDHHYFITRNKDLATNLVKIDNNSDNSIKIVKELKDPNTTHKYTAKHCIDLIKEQLLKKNIDLIYNGNLAKFNRFHFTNFCKHFGLKENTEYCYIHKQFTTPQYSYSQKTVDFIVTELSKDPKHILNNIKK